MTIELVFTDMFGGLIMKNPVSNMNSSTNSVKKNEKKRQKNILEVMMLNKIRKETEELKFKDKEDLLKNLYLAKKEIEQARNNFEIAVDDAMIDYFTYKMKAAEIRYQYLLKKVKEKKIKN